MAKYLRFHRRFQTCADLSTRRLSVLVPIKRPEWSGVHARSRARIFTSRARAVFAKPVKNCPLSSFEWLLTTKSLWTGSKDLAVDLGRRRLLLCCMRIIGKKEIFGGVQIPCDVRFNPVVKSWTARNIASLVLRYSFSSFFFSFLSF